VLLFRLCRDLELFVGFKTDPDIPVETWLTMVLVVMSWVDSSALGMLGQGVTKIEDRYIMLHFVIKAGPRTTSI